MNALSRTSGPAAQAIAAELDKDDVFALHASEERAVWGPVRSGGAADAVVRERVGVGEPGLQELGVGLPAVAVGRDVAGGDRVADQPDADALDLRAVRAGYQCQRGGGEDPPLALPGHAARV